MNNNNEIRLGIVLNKRDNYIFLEKLNNEEIYMRIL